MLSLDVFRGITIVLMIIVNSPGNQTAYYWLEHSQWNGCTLADCVFPFFIFIVGISLVFSLSKQVEREVQRKELLTIVLKRSAIIFLLGLFLNAFPNHFDFSTIRIYGVLQRIALCYFFASLLFLITRPRTQALIMGGLLISYWLAMTLIPVPGYGSHNLTQEGNLAAYIDRMLFSSDHLYGKVFDPEGLLSTFPAFATVLLGSLTGTWLLSKYSSQKKLLGIVISGILAITGGWIWGLWFPINKSLWTSSYVLLTGGLALGLLGICYWLIEIKLWIKWSKVFEIFGVNAIAAYFLHIFFLKIQAMIHIHHLNGTYENLRIIISEHLFSWVSLYNASLFYALSYMMVWLIILGILYRQKVFIKI